MGIEKESEKEEAMIFRAELKAGRQQEMACKNLQLVESTHTQCVFTESLYSSCPLSKI